jgi:tripartite-type tricarboxylate transporter receptor subunit TctC
LYPELPTVAAAGVPGYESASIYVLFGPARLPAAMIRLLNQKMVQGLTTSEIKEKFLNIGAELHGSSPERAAAMMNSEIARMGKLIREAHIRAD